jgi:succinate dehydrogenase/fumarate reductase flavoprotein subunit
MWRHVGILRNGKELKAMLAQLESLKIPEAAATREENELKNLHSLAKVIAQSAIAREESRGSHYRSDFPYRDDDDFQKHSLIRKGGEVTFEK